MTVRTKPEGEEQPGVMQVGACPQTLLSQILYSPPVSPSSPDTTCFSSSGYKQADAFLENY
jgi:hypothetical protein